MRWTEFERSPRYAVGQAVARVRWRAEVLTLEPRGDGTRLTLRIDHEGSAPTRPCRGAANSMTSPSSGPCTGRGIGQSMASER